MGWDFLPDRPIDSQHDSVFLQQGAAIVDVLDLLLLSQQWAVKHLHAHRKWSVIPLSGATHLTSGRVLTWGESRPTLWVAGSFSTTSTLHLASPTTSTFSSASVRKASRPRITWRSDVTVEGRWSATTMTSSSGSSWTAAMRASGWSYVVGTNKQTEAADSDP